MRYTTLTMTELQAALRTLVVIGALVLLATNSRSAAAAPVEPRTLSRQAVATSTGCMASCILGGPVAAKPTRLALGETAEVAIQANLTCDAASTLVDGPADIVFVVDYSYSMVYPTGRLTEAQRLATQLIGSLRPDLHRVGAVAYDAQAKLISLLTSDFTPVSAGITSLTATPHGRSTSLHAGLNLARQVLQGDMRVGLPVAVIILGDGEFDLNNPWTVADDLRAQGVDLFAVGFTEKPDNVALLQRVVGDPAHYFPGRNPDEVQLALDALTALQIPPKVTDVTLDYVLTGDIEGVSGSSQPMATETPAGVRWTQDFIVPGQVDFGYQIRPRVIGNLPVAKSITASYTNCDGQIQHADFAIPSIDVVGPESTPTSVPTLAVSPTSTSTSVPPSSMTPSATAPPTDTPAPATATATLTATSVPHPGRILFVPFAARPRLSGR